MKKIKDLLNKFKKIDPKELEIFISEILGKDKSFVTAHPEHKLTLRQYLKIIYFVYQRKRGYSVAAIVRHKEFYNLDFFVNKHVLIPRPDTELMVAEATRIMNNELRIKNTNLLYIDVGTGSGCIPISITCHLERSREIPYTRRKGFLHYGRNDIQIFATDISRSALRVAKKNAKIHGVKINFFHGNLLEPILSVIPAASGNPDNSTGHWIPNQVGNDKHIIITANLPYLTEQQFQDEPSIWREPKTALVAANNGLALYEELLQQIKQLSSILNSKFYILLEIDPSQTEAIAKIIKKYLPQSTIDIKKDLAERDRIVKITK